MKNKWKQRIMEAFHCSVTWNRTQGNQARRNKTRKRVFKETRRSFLCSITWCDACSWWRRQLDQLSDGLNSCRVYTHNTFKWSIYTVSTVRIWSWWPLNIVNYSFGEMFQGKLKWWSMIRNYQHHVTECDSDFNIIKVIEGNKSPWKEIILINAKCLWSDGRPGWLPVQAEITERGCL